MPIKFEYIWFFFEITFSFLKASYSEFESPMLSVSLKWIFSGTVFGLFGKLFDKGKISEITTLYKNLNKNFYN